jgi:hypothetical protein
MRSNRARNQAWVIAEQDDGHFQVWHGRRMVVSGLQALPSAKTIVTDNRKLHEKVYLADKTGYRHDLTGTYRAIDRATVLAEQRHRVATEIDPNDPHPVRTRYLARYGRNCR